MDRRTRASVHARNVVATSQPLATQAGVRALREGGNAMDAALAAAITLTVVEPTGCGLGSDAFAIVAADGALHGLNGSGRSPRAWTRERFAGTNRMPERGWESVTVPGAVAAWRDLSRQFGALPFAALFRDAIHYARQGFCVSPHVAGGWQASAPVLWQQPGFAEAFLPGGRAPRVGERFALPALADSLEAIARSDGEAFYTGALAERMVADAAAHGGALSAADLADHRSTPVVPLAMASPTLGNTLHELPPNGQGIAALLALGYLDRLDIGRFAVDDPLALHLQIEAVKLAFADLHRWVADPEAMTLLTPEELLASARLNERAACIDLREARDHGPGRPGPGGTVYLCAADERGMMVSFIQSNYMGFGSGVVVPGTGISLQNRGAGFVLDADHPNQVAGGKRPFHTIIPGFLTSDDGEPLMAFGVMGGPMQAQGHLQLALRTSLWDQDPQQAIDAPRWRVMDGRRVVVEPGFPARTLDVLRRLGHDVQAADGSFSTFSFGGAQAILRTATGYVAGSDPRKDGHAAGF